MSLTLGQVGHVLLTRSPLGSSSASTGALVRLACIKHAASVRPEPGSNSPLYEIKIFVVLAGIDVKTRRIPNFQ